MEKEKLIKILKKTQSLEQGGNVALAKEFDYIDENIKNIDAKVDTLSNSIDSKLDTLSEELKKKLESELVLEIDREELKGERGEQGEQGLKGDKGDKGDTTIVEKVIEKTEVIRETPIVTNEIKEVAVADTPDELVVKLETLKGEDRLDASAIKNLPEFIEQSPVPNGGGWRNLFQLHDVSIPNPTNGQTLVYNSTTKLWEANTVSSSVAWGDITGTLSDQTDLQTELNDKQDTLVSGTNIKTINGSTLLGAGDLVVGGGDVSKVGTPVNNQIGVWTGDGTIEGDINLTFNGNLTVGAGGYLIGGGVQLTGGANNIIFDAGGANATTLELVSDGVLGISNSLSVRGSIGVNNLTANRAYTLPDADGTIALVSNIAYTTQSISTDQALTETTGEHIKLVDATSADVTLTLPTAVGNTAKFTIKKIDSSANQVITDADGTETIDGDLTAIINFQYTSFTIISDNANWHII